MKRGYIAAVLDHDFAEDLRNETEMYGRHDNVRCEHVTMAYNPSDEVFKKYENLIGRDVFINVQAVVHDDRAQAAIVTGLPSENEVAHITLSLADGVPASYTKSLFHNPDRVDTTFIRGGKATVRFVQHQGAG